MRSRFLNNVYGWTLVMPFFISLVVFFVFALMRTIVYSFSSYDMFSPAKWVGLSNYWEMLSDPLFMLATVNTVTFAAIVTSIQTVLALGLAVLLNSQIKAKSFFRTAFYVPSILSSAAVTLIFIWFYQKNGFLNDFLSYALNHISFVGLFLLSLLAIQLFLVFVGRFRGYPLKLLDPAAALLAVPIAMTCIYVASNFGWLMQGDAVISTSWLGTRDTFGPMPVTLWAIVIQNIYTTVPTIMLLFLAGLQSIPGDLYEAAQIDGAGKWQQLLHVTVPQLAPVTFVVVTLGIIGTLQMFDQVALLGTASPLESRITLAYYVYHNAFPDSGTPEIGTSSAAALFLGVLTLLIVFIQNKFGVQEKAND